ncbi:hypothetical protein ASD39_04130 [Sphingomonas sp. Root50]|nr:hypothetical protein ASD39_04130 [Sphingomonas sp. Root50]KRB88004.1 hypothetical protein ASE22_21305 [Sphingomonas sp. Root720]
MAFAAMLFGWPAGALRTAMRSAASGPRHGRLRRILDAWWLAVTRNVPPFEYRAYRLDQPEARAGLPHYLFWTDLPAIATLNARRGADVRDVQDKARFSAICEAHGLPAIPTLAAFRDGRQILPDLPFAPEEPDLWVKGLTGSGGQGAAHWRRERGSYRDGNGVRVAVADVADRMAKEDCIVQPRIANHPAVADITNGALASLRVVTGLSEGRAVALAAMLYLPSGTRTTSIAGIGCAIDLARGVLTRALDFRNDAREIEVHPDTGNAIVGRTLPFWQESLRLATDAHQRAFDRFVFLGWDVALAEGGPLLLEANAGWSALHLQRLNGPLGLTDFSRIVDAHI